ncbi:MAG: Restriction alleviation protein Lar [Pseudomonadota bacterium]|nr:Restriction alleviation protein Lar [Pseudomonadota bacterium]
MSAKLKPCEHCKQVPTLGHSMGRFRVFCHWGANLSVPACRHPQEATGGTLAEAIEAWNTRKGEEKT